MWELDETGSPAGQQIHQFECRWQPNRDFSPVAGSMPPDEAWWWFDRISLWARHGAGGGADETPAESVRYGTLADGRAALAWRYGNLGVDGVVETRTVVSRVLVGPADLLTPEVAVAVCYTGLPEAVGPRPGTFAGSQLPPVSSASLLGLVAEVADEIDERAVRAPGLGQLIAAALSDPATPLAVQLPGPEMIRSPEDGAQAPLLWGLRRIAWPLMAVATAEPPGTRGWSFSTFEPPQGTRDPAALPGIVFRARKALQPASSTRDEVLVQPYDPRPLAPGRYDDVAGLLARAYEYLGGSALAEKLWALATRYPRVDQRIQVAYAELLELLAPGEAPGETAVEVTITAAAARATATYPAGRIAADAPPLRLPDRPAPGAPAPSLASPGVTSMLRRLDTGSGPEFEVAWRSLLEAESPAAPEDRAAARQLMVERVWFIEPLLRHDQWDYVSGLAAIFRLTVIPDLGDPEVVAEVGRWVAEYAAPHEVIVALDAAARQPDYAEPDLMRALLPALGQRWMLEHGIRALSPDVPVAAVLARYQADPPVPADPPGSAGPAIARRFAEWTVPVLVALLVCNVILLILHL